MIPQPYRLRLEGAAELRDPAGRVVPFRTRKALLLLAVLFESPDGLSRADLAARVWDDCSPDAARASLRTALTALHATLPDTILALRDRISLVPGRIVLEAGEGEFMPGYEELWALDERLRRRAEAVRCLLGEAKACADDEKALELAERACALDPLNVRAARARERLLLRIGRTDEAMRSGERFRIRFVREFGSPPEPAPSRPVEEHPLVASAEWTLERDPEEACALLAGSHAQWTTVAVDRSLEIHERALALSRRPGRDRQMVEAWTWCLRVVNGRVTDEVRDLATRQQEALVSEEPVVAIRLTEAIAYACLSRGEFADALIHARKGADLARHHLDPLGAAGAEMTLGIIEQHAGSYPRARQRMSDALRTIEEHGSPTTIAMHAILRTANLISDRRYDEAFAHIEKCYRMAETLSAARMRPWILHNEALLFEETGDLPNAQSLFEELRREAHHAGQAAIAIAEDALFRVNCKLGELDTAAEALARGTLYRRKMGTVPSRFERAQLAPAVRMIRERLDPRDLAAAFRKAAATG